MAYAITLISSLSNDGQIVNDERTILKGNWPPLRTEVNRKRAVHAFPKGLWSKCEEIFNVISIYETIPSSSIEFAFKISSTIKSDKNNLKYEMLSSFFINKIHLFTWTHLSNIFTENWRNYEK